MSNVEVVSDKNTATSIVVLLPSSYATVLLAGTL